MAVKKNKGLSSPMRVRDHVTAYLMILPAFALLVIFVIIPLVMALMKSFTDWSFYGDSTFVGLKNFSLVFTNELFQKSMLNGLKYVLCIVPVQMVLSFLFAHVLKHLIGAYGNVIKTVIYIPTVISGVVASVIFLFILDYRAGLMNEIFKLIGIGRVAFMTDETMAFVSIVLPAVWLGFGYNSLVMYAGLINIPTAYYEAADVDGASTLAKLIHITIPSMKNVFVLLSIGLVTGTLQMFDLPFIMTGGGPVNSTLPPMMFLYNNFRAMDKTMGYTIAGALMMMVVIAAINSIVFKLIRSEKSTDA